MPTDLTRFDFHAMRFLHSEAVESMTAEEIGQYILLLCKAWVVGKDTSLPDDMMYLAATAKGKVSKKVLDQFPVMDTEWGPRRRNSVLYGEWLIAQSRSESASERGQKGNEIRWGIAKASQPYRNSDGKAIASDIAQTKPSQTKPNQASQVSQECDFHNITIKYRTGMGKKHSKSKWFREKYAAVCAEFGEDAVLAEFEDWAENNKWRADSLKDTGLRFFFSDVAEMIEESAAVHKMEKSAEGSAQESDLLAQTAITLGREAGRQEFETRHAAVRAENEITEPMPLDQF